MYCKYCGKHLYERITFKNIFKIDYSIHEQCESLLNRSTDYLTFPILDKLVLMDYLFEESCDDSEDDFLYQKYSWILFDRLLHNDSWSIVVLVEYKLEYDDVLLILKMADKSVLFLNLYYENFM